jgi:DNA-binding phage protein
MKKHKVKMSDYKTFEEFEKGYFEEDPRRIEAVNKEMIKEFYATPDMKIEDLLVSLQSFNKANKMEKHIKSNGVNVYREISLGENPKIHTVVKVANDLEEREVG